LESAGVTVDLEKRVYRCDEPPNDSDEAANELGFESSKELFK